MNIKPITCGYIPPQSFKGAEAFLRNLRQWQPKHDAIFFSDYPWGGDIMPIKGSPESIRGAKYEDGRPNKWALNNWLYLTALRILREKPEYTHLLWVESDSRVLGEDWDDIIFTEALSGNDLPIMAGSIVGYNVANHGADFTRAWNRFVAQNVDKHAPVPCYGGNGAAEEHQPVVFPNGSGALYDIAWVSKHFDLSDPPPPVAPPRKLPVSYNLGGRGGPSRVVETELTGTKKLAATTTAFDFALGRYAVLEFGSDVFSKLRHLNSVYSGFGNVMFSQTERQQMLLDGQVRLVHQVKDDWLPEVTVAPKFIGGVAERQTQRGEGSDSPANADSLGKTGSIPAAPTIIEAMGNLLDKAEQCIEAGIDPSFAKVMGIKPRVDIFIVSYRPDFRWLEYCLKSIAKYDKGFGKTTVLIPRGDYEELEKYWVGDTNIAVYDEAPAPKGHLSHLIAKCHADSYFPDADYICHLDSDCVFTEPVTPDSFFHKGKPVLLQKEFRHLQGEEKAQLWWQAQTERALKMECPFLCMCRHPSIHPRLVYAEMRQWIADNHNMPFEEYVLAQKPTRLPGFSEFCALGMFAYGFYDQLYHWIDVTHKKAPHNPLKQFWSFSEWTPELVAELEEIVK